MNKLTIFIVGFILFFILFVNVLVLLVTEKQKSDQKIRELQYEIDVKTTDRYYGKDGKENTRKILEAINTQCGSKQEGTIE